MQFNNFPNSILCILRAIWILSSIALVATTGCQPHSSDGTAIRGESSASTQKSPIIVTYDNGTPCQEDGSICTSGYCVDGVCCESACDGLCMGCSKELNDTEDGKCLPIRDNPAPTAPKENDCSVNADNVCGPTGYCSGHFAEGSTDQSVCSLATNEIVCQEARCYANDAYSQSNCDGFGNCGADIIQEQCGYYACRMNGPNPVCRTSCSSDDHCDETASAWCYLGLESNPNYGTCVVGKRDGEEAQSASECGSAQQADGVCCSSACNETCNACNSQFNGAISGTCSVVTAGTTWIQDCPLAAPASCGFTGSCDGAGACVFYDTATECAAAECNGSILAQPGLCDGAGTCNGSTSSQSCAPWNCNPVAEPAVACFDDCNNNFHCARDYCEGGATCVLVGSGDTVGRCDDNGNGSIEANELTSCARCYISADASNKFCTHLKLDGESCGANTECASGHCTDGVCCEASDCPGECRSCNQTKTGGEPGRCAVIRDGTDPDGECTDGTCTSATTAIPASTCNGGSCSDETEEACEPYTCTNNACNEACTSPDGERDDVHCAPATPYCNGGVCSNNRRPVALDSSHSVAYTQSGAFSLTGTDPDGDALFFELHPTIPNGVTLNDVSTGGFTYTPDSCRGNESFQFRVYDRAGTTDRLYSSYATVTLTINNLLPTVSIDKSPPLTAPFGTGISRGFTYSDPGNCGGNIGVTTSNSGHGTPSIPSYGNGSGTVSWTPDKGNITHRAVCNGTRHYSHWGEQQSTVYVTAQDQDGGVFSDSVYLQMQAATQCNDRCTSREWYCFWQCCTETIGPSNCRYCQDKYSNRCRRESCSTCCFGWWDWPCWNCNCRCVEYEEYVSGNSCDETWSWEGLGNDIVNFFADGFCDWFGLFCSGERCDWD